MAKGILNLLPNRVEQTTATTVADPIEQQLQLKRVASEKIKALYQKFPGRKAQLVKLNNLIGRGQCVGPEVIYLWGDTATGKTSVVQAYFQALFPHPTLHHYVYINGTELFTPKIFFERILNTFNQSFPTFPPVDFKSSFVKCNQLSQFLEKLTEIVERRRGEVFTWYLVIDQVEKLKDANWNFLPVLFKLSEKTGGNFSTILIGKVPWENLAPSIGVQEPILIHFPDYTKQELVNILTITSPHTLPPLAHQVDNNLTVFRNFAGMLYDTLYRYCHNTKELQHIANQIYPHYVQPILDGTVLPSETAKLFTQCRTHFEQATSAIYSRGGNFSTEPNSLKQSTLLLHLPYYSKFLLVASYLASYNPAKTDINYFYKGTLNQHQKRQRKIVNPTKQVEKSAKIPTCLLGPKPFTIERMLAIFYSIVDDPNLTTTVHIDTQVATLISLQLIAPTTSTASSTSLSTLKYKAVLSLETTQLVARQLQFQLERFLFTE